MRRETKDSPQRNRKERGRFQLIGVVVVASLLVLGVGPATAAHLNVRSSDIVNGHVRTPDLRNGAVKAPKIAPNAVRSNKIRNGHVRQPDLAGRVIAAQAYAYVIGAGVDENKSVNIADANITNPSVGTYCVSGLPFTVRHAQATPEFSGNSIGLFTNNSGFCPGPDDQVRVQVRNSAGTLVNSGFSLTIF